MLSASDAMQALRYIMDLQCYYLQTLAVSQLENLRMSSTANGKWEKLQAFRFLFIALNQSDRKLDL